MKELGKEYKLQGEYDGFYPKWNEERQESFDVFKYALKGSPEAIAEYKTKMVEKGYTVRYADEAETKPIFFTLDFAGQQAEIKITTGGAIVINDEQLRQIQSLAKRTNGIIQEKIADQGVAMLLGNILVRMLSQHLLKIEKRKMRMRVFHQMKQILKKRVASNKTLNP